MASVQDARTSVLEIVGNAIVGGMESYVARLVARLPADRFRITCLAPFESRFTRELRSHGAEVLLARITDNPQWDSIQMASTIVKTREIDVLHAHLANAHILAALAGKITGKPVVGTVHGRSMPMGDFEAHRLGNTHLSVVCQSTYQHAIALGANPAYVHLVPNGVDCDLFAPRSGETFLHDELGLAPGTPLVGFVGRLSGEKGPEVFLRAALVMHQARPDVRFVLVGDGPLQWELKNWIASSTLR